MLPENCGAFDGSTTVTINTVSPSGFGHVVIFERSTRADMVRAPPEILDPSDFGANTKSMGKWCVFSCFSSHALSLNPAAAGPLCHPPAAGVGHIVAPLYFCDDIVARWRHREAKLCTHLFEYLAKIVSKFSVDPIWNGVTHSDVRRQIIDLRLSVSSRYIRYVRPNTKNRLLVRN